MQKPGETQADAQLRQMRVKHMVKVQLNKAQARIDRHLQGQTVDKPASPAEIIASHIDTGVHRIWGIPRDLSTTPPIPCDFKIGDLVTYTNDAGLKFKGKVVIGFSETVSGGRFVYYNSDSFWFPVQPESLTLERAASPSQTQVV